MFISGAVIPFDLVSKGDFGPIIRVSEEIMMVWMLLYYMYKKKIFLKV